MSVTTSHTATERRNQPSMLSSGPVAWARTVDGGPAFLPIAAREKLRVPGAVTNCTPGDGNYQSPNAT